MSPNKSFYYSRSNQLAEIQVRRAETFPANHALKSNFRIPCLMGEQRCTQGCYGWRTCFGEIAKVLPTNAAHFTGANYDGIKGLRKLLIKYAIAKDWWNS